MTREVHHFFQHETEWKEMCKAFQIRNTDHLLTYSQKFLACEIVLQK